MIATIYLKEPAVSNVKLSKSNHFQKMSNGGAARQRRRHWVTAKQTVQLAECFLGSQCATETDDTKVITFKEATVHWGKSIQNTKQ
jgi:hypothetical protein